MSLSENQVEIFWKLQKTKLKKELDFLIPSYIKNIYNCHGNWRLIVGNPKKHEEVMLLYRVSYDFSTCLKTNQSLSMLRIKQFSLSPSLHFSVFIFDFKCCDFDSRHRLIGAVIFHLDFFACCDSCLINWRRPKQWRWIGWISTSQSILFALDLWASLSVISNFAFYRMNNGNERKEKNQLANENEDWLHICTINHNNDCLLWQIKWISSSTQPTADKSAVYENVRQQINW